MMNHFTPTQIHQMLGAEPGRSELTDLVTTLRRHTSMTGDGFDRTMKRLLEVVGRRITDEHRTELLGQMEEATRSHWDCNVGLNEVACSCDMTKHMTRREFRTHLLTLITDELGADG